MTQDPVTVGRNGACSVMLVIGGFYAFRTSSSTEGYAIVKCEKVTDDEVEGKTVAVALSEGGPRYCRIILERLKDFS